MPICESLPELEEAIKRQEGWDEPEADWNKIKFNGDFKFGAEVVAEFDDTPSERGYLTMIPPYYDVDLHSWVHFEKLWGEKQGWGPAWITLNDLLRLPGIRQVTIG